MSEPKPSEVLRPLLDAYYKSFSEKSTRDFYQANFTILDRLDAEQRRLAAKVVGQPASEPTLGLAAELSYMLSKFVTREKELEAASGGLYAKDDILIRRAEALLSKSVAKPDPTTEAPKLAELERKLEAKSEEADTLHTKLSAAESECERLRGLIRDFTESMTKTLGDGLPKGAVR